MKQFVPCCPCELYPSSGATAAAITGPFLAFAVHEVRHHTTCLSWQFQCSCTFSHLRIAAHHLCQFHHDIDALCYAQTRGLAHTLSMHLDTVMQYVLTCLCSIQCMGDHTTRVSPSNSFCGSRFSNLRNMMFSTLHVLNWCLMLHSTKHVDLTIFTSVNFVTVTHYVHTCLCNILCMWKCNDACRLEPCSLPGGKQEQQRLRKGRWKIGGCSVQWFMWWRKMGHQQCANARPRDNPCQLG